MERKFFIILLTIICIFAFSANAFALSDTGIGTTINGVPVQYNETSGYPFIDSAYRTLVPLRAAMEAYGCTVNWIQETQTAVVSSGNITVNVPVGYNCIYVNGIRQETDTQATVLEGRIFLPIRAVLEAFGAQVGFDFATNCVTVTKNTNQLPPDPAPETQKLSSKEISAMCSNSVFCIETYGFNGKISGLGSGFFISADGLAFTNFHVVANSSYLVIHTADGKIFDKIDIIDFNEEKDIALLKVHGDSFPYIKLGDSDKIQQGQQVYAIGSPLGLDNTMSEGIIANISRLSNNNSYIQISVPINHGSSGGALINENGEAIGITSNGLTESDLNFAIPINVAKTLNTTSTESYIIWQQVSYPGFTQALDFGAFSGVTLTDYETTPLGYVFLYDIFDFYDCADLKASENYGNTIYYYYYALLENGFEHTLVIDDFWGMFESDTETILSVADLETEGEEGIYIIVQKKPQYYSDFGLLIDFGWYSEIPLYEEYSMEQSYVFSYKWSDYYDVLDFLYVISDYLGLLETEGFICVYEDEDGFLYEGNGYSIVILINEKYIYFDIQTIPE